MSIKTKFKELLSKLNFGRTRMSKIILMVYDIVAINLSYLIVLWLRFDCNVNDIDPLFIEAFLKFSPIYTVFCIIIFRLLKLYRSIWTFASYKEFFNVAYSSAITAVFHTVGITLLFSRMPITYYFFGALLQFFTVLIVRFAYRFVLLERSRRSIERVKKASNVMLIGAGAAGRMILHDMNLATGSKEKVRCLIDDNENKWGRFIDNVPIVGGRNKIIDNVKKYKINKIYITIPSISTADKSAILDICKETGCELKILPDIYHLVDGEINTKKLKEVAIEDLLGRDQITINNDEIFEILQDKVILVTGGGGSIGSELCRQIAAHRPRQLIIFDIYENNAYDIEQELRSSYPGLNLEVLIGSVRDSRKIYDVFAKYKPQVVYHAAAHKHVPLMEHSPSEAIKNNVIGTYKTAYAAVMNGCKRFVLISTDKAVNPTNIMGASKRLCEMIIQSFDMLIKKGEADKICPIYDHDDGNSERLGEGDIPEAKTEFVAVRFGNVLGSNGSVIPVFKKQIAQGGPVTVTHPDIIRYFMTIPEAVSLVLQAGTYASGGEIFVLDMGAPVKIDTLARNLIKLSGLIPDEDIKIVYSGLRPGEKLYEERLMAEEGLRITKNKLINICNPLDFDSDKLVENLVALMKICYDEPERVKDFVESIVPTYHPAGEHGTEEKTEAYKQQLKDMALAGK